MLKRPVQKPKPNPDTQHTFKSIPASPQFILKCRSILEQHQQTQNPLHNEEPIELPERDPAKRFTIVLDLDETLIHTSFQRVRKRPDFFFHFDKVSYNTNVRPYCSDFLTHLQTGGYEVILWTASTSLYAGPIIAKLQEKRKQFDYCLFRQHCTFSGTTATVQEQHNSS